MRCKGGVPWGRGAVLQGRDAAHPASVIYCYFLDYLCYRAQICVAALLLRPSFVLDDPYEKW